MIEKLDMKSMNITEENVKKIQQVFPNCVTEVKENGKVKLAVDFDALKEELTGNIIADKQERYQFTWPDKAKAKQTAVSPISKTLRPVKEDETVPTGEDSNGKPYCSTGSVDFDSTQNLYIEGDNLDVLKLLQETYLGRVKMIYIDPPYNTGNDFVYNDDFAQDANEYLGNSGQYDEHGNRLFQNTESNGRFHTDWLNMIYPRLRLAKDLLDKDGVLFISMADNELCNQLKVCEEIFGKNNIEIFVWKKKGGAGNTEKIIGVLTEYIICCFKNKKPYDLNYQTFDRVYKFKDKISEYNLEGIEKTNLGAYERKTMQFAIIDPKTNVAFYPSENMRWTLGEQTVNELISAGKIYFDYETQKVKRIKRPEDYALSENVFYNLLTEEGSLAIAKDECGSLLNNRELFDTPKPSALIKKLLLIGSKKESIILDFFSGSGTTAHAVMQLNAEDGGNRKFIMVQLPEPCDEKSEAHKAGYKYICEIGKERIRRAGKKIKAENGEKAQNLDIGFRVLKLDSSNMQPVYYNPHAITQSLLDSTIDNVKTDRTPVDLLFQVMLDLGVFLSAKIEEKQVNDKHYYVVNDNDLIACFDDDIDNSVITEIAKQKPLYAVFKDRSFATDSVGINNEQLFKTYSPTTIVKVI